MSTCSKNKKTQKYKTYVKKNYTISVPTNYKPISYYCEICDVLLATIEDIECYRKNKACIECYDKHYYNNKEKWDKGWRPK